MKEGIILSAAADEGAAKETRPEQETYRSLLKKGALRLEKAGVPDAAWDASLLLGWAGGPDRTHLPLFQNAAVSARVQERFTEGIRRRESRIPLQQIMENICFMGFDFYVNEDVLCPRADTEVLTELALTVLTEKGNQSPRILDLCCGSGCIGISLARLLPQAKVCLSDISPRALAVARINAEKNAVLDQVCFAQGDLTDAVTDDGKKLRSENGDLPFDLICCNPPYIPSREIEGLMPEVRDHEPHLALDGGEDGLDFYRRLAKELRGATHILLEIGCEQAEAVRRIFHEAGWDHVTVHRDLAGLDRVVRIQ